MKTVFLEFTKPFGPYSTGDSAGFAEDSAARYLELGVAKRAGEKDSGEKPVAAPVAADAAAEAAPVVAGDQPEPQASEAAAPDAPAAAAEAQATPETAEQPAADKPKAPKGKTAKQ